MTAWISAKGTVVAGHRLASGLAVDNPFGGSTIGMQMPLFARHGLDLSHCFPGTLNVSIAPMIWNMLLADPQFRDLKWHADFPAEDFFISPCRVLFGGVSYESFVYYPDPRKKIAHQKSPSLFEILAPRIPGISYGDSVTLFLDPSAVRISS